nr:uncharacterized protein LOC111512658 [Leptinotarsa decemlineata]
MNLNQTAMSSLHEECSQPKRPRRPKKLKKPEKMTDATTSFWDKLPSVVLTEIYSFLDHKDRRSASSVCKHWREQYFHPRFWTSVEFVIESDNLERVRFLSYMFGTMAVQAKIVIHSLNKDCLKEFVILFDHLARNNNLKSLILEPSYCYFVGWDRDDWKEVMNLLNPCLPKLSKFSIGCVEDLSFFLEGILTNLNPSLITDLGLATVKDDPTNYVRNNFDPRLLSPFPKLEVLSIDYDQLSDELLAILDSATELRKLIVHLHAISEEHPGTTDEAWIKFRKKHPACQLSITIIHAFRDIDVLDQHVLRRHMPLTHLKVFFCEKVNIRVIENLSNYAETLRSIVWVDSLTDEQSSWALVKPFYDDSPDPFVLAAWLCKRLEEIVLFGYKYWEENLIAIGRLRGGKLKRLDIAEPDIVKRPGQDLASALLDIPNSIDKPWKPVQVSELHPVICNPVEGDSDEYLLPLVLADLH